MAVEISKPFHFPKLSYDFSSAIGTKFKRKPLILFLIVAWLSLVSQLRRGLGIVVATDRAIEPGVENSIQRGGNVRNSSVSPIRSKANNDSMKSSGLEFVRELSEEDPRDGRLWIQVQSWYEGLAAWTTSMSELVVAAKSINATLVEPDITNSLPVPSGRLRLSEIYDRGPIENYLGPERYSSRKEFEAQMAKTRQKEENLYTFDLCLNRCTPISVCRGPTPCKTENGTELKSYFQANRSPVLDQAIQAAASGKNVVLKIHNYWKHSLKWMTFGAERRTLVPTDAWQEFHKSGWRFSQELYKMADDMLQRRGVSGNDFATIHWRADRPDIDYLDCARAIIGVKEEMKLPVNTSVFLMSSLMSDPSLQWPTSLAKAKNSSALEALSLLVDENDFQKVDSLIKDLPLLQQELDSIVVVALDLIIASKAKYFSTCDRSCSKEYCAACNHLGRFAGSAINLRREEGKQSSRCWVLPSGFVPRST